MLTEKEKMISERNQKLINFISELNLGIHILGLPENPYFVSKDYKYLFHGYVKNFQIILNDKEFDANTILTCRVDANAEQLREKFIEWMEIYEPKRVYTLWYGDLFLIGFNHHDKIQFLRPFPVFGRYFLTIYHKIEHAEDTVAGFPEYNLIVK